MRVKKNIIYSIINIKYLNFMIVDARCLLRDNILFFTTSIWYWI